jgi:arylsulfatase A-like enzyme
MRSFPFWVQRLRRAEGIPFLMVAGLFHPHQPWWIPQHYFDLYPLDEIVLPEVRADELGVLPAWGRKLAGSPSEYRQVVDSGKWPELVQAYLAAVSFADAQVGRLLEALDHGPHRENTIVVLWSDHGFHHGQKHCFGKSTLWQAAARIPFILRLPGVVPATVNRPMDSIDIYPTLVDLCGLAIGGYALDGVSMRPLIDNPEAPWKPAVTELQRKNVAVRDEAWTYIRYDDRTEELYHRAVDPRERRNLAALPEYADVKQRLRVALPRSYAVDALPRKGDDNPYAPPALRPGFIEFAE